MAFCYNCGKKLNNGSKFCSECGVKQEVTDNTSVRKQEFIDKVSELENNIDGYTAIEKKYYFHFFR